MSEHTRNAPVIDASRVSDDARRLRDLAAEGRRFREVSVAVDRKRLDELAAAEGENPEAERDDRIPIAISSEAPCERYDWWEGERYNEVR